MRDDTDIVLDRSVVLDRDVRVRSLRIPAGRSLVLDPGRAVLLRSTGNVVVEGVLRAAPASATRSHVLRFEGVREQAFRGGGMEPLASDVGLWVTGPGRLELQGAARTPWTRLARAARKGQTTLSLAARPSGWRPGDEVVVTPTGSPQDPAAHDRYDAARIRSISGATVVLDRPLAHDHPLVQVAPELRLGPELLNLTRNVRVEGTPAGRSHLWLTSTRRSVLEHFSLRHMGPRQADGDVSKSVLGRYALHLHMNREASRGTHVDGVVVRDSGSHAFVPHLSHGVTFRGCISHDTFDEAFWHDPPERGSREVVQDLVYDGCVASRVRVDPDFRGFRLAGFYLGSGERVTARRCVAVGVQGNKDAAGFTWPEGDEGFWVFKDNVSHNNKAHGSFVWQNAQKIHSLETFVSYHNGDSGFSHGAYGNSYRYLHCIAHGNGRAGLRLHALSNGEAPLYFSACRFDGARLSDHVVVTAHHTLVGNRPVLLRDCTLSGYRVAGLGLVYEGDNGPSKPDVIDFVDCTFEGNELRFADGVAPGARVLLQTTGTGALLVGGPRDPGTYVARWNGRYREVPQQPRPAKAERRSPRLPSAGPLPTRTALAACPQVGGSGRAGH